MRNTEALLASITWKNVFNRSSSASHIVLEKCWPARLCLSSLRFEGIYFMHNSLNMLAQHLYWVEVWTLTQSFIFFFFSYSDVNFLVCLESLSCCMTQFQPSLSCRTNGLTFVWRIFWTKVEFIIVSVTAGFPGPVAAKHHKPFHLQDSQVLWLKLWLFFKSIYTVIYIIILYSINTFIQSELRLNLLELPLTVLKAHHLQKILSTVA